MRVSLLSAVLAVAPLAVSASGRLGFSLGNLRADGTCKKQADYELDFDALKGHTSIVRTYTSAGCNTAQEILPAAANKQIKVILGVWFVTGTRHPSPIRLFNLELIIAR